MMDDFRYRAAAVFTQRSLRTQAIVVLFVGIGLILGGYDGFRWVAKIGIFYLVVGGSFLFIHHTGDFSYRTALVVASLGVVSCFLYLTTDILLGRLEYAELTASVGVDVLILSGRRVLDIVGMAGVFLGGVARDVSEQQFAAGVFVAAFGLLFWIEFFNNYGTAFWPFFDILYFLAVLLGSLVAGSLPYLVGKNFRIGR